MNRHRIVGLAAVALVALRLPTMASEQVKLYLPLVSRMPAPTPTPTIIPGHSSLSGRVFFDYNGSGLQEQEEPGIPGVLVHVDSVGSALHAVTAADGSYSIPNVPTGAHRLYIQSPTQDSATAFQYINVFKGWVNIAAYEINGVQVPAQHLPDTEIRPID
ncbi:MAG: hypothetical protein FJ026_04945, partial [Chloroflexi bacterium]|nr:hypothetical protein [Chloroflexota bacterium]